MLLAGGYYVARPLWSQTARATAATASTPLWSLHERKEQIYTTIKELELDHSQDKLSERDYSQQRQGLESEALALIERLDELDGDRDDAALREQIESEIHGLRAQACSSCGRSGRPSDRFCPHCGNEHAQPPAAEGDGDLPRIN